MTDDQAETIGELVGENADGLADAERVLFRFISAAEDADGEVVPPWLRTAHAAVSAVSQHHRARLDTGGVGGYNQDEKLKDDVIEAARDERFGSFVSTGAYAARQRSDGTVLVYQLTEEIEDV